MTDATVKMVYMLLFIGQNLYKHDIFLDMYSP